MLIFSSPIKMSSTLLRVVTGNTKSNIYIINVTYSGLDWTSWYSLLRRHEGMHLDKVSCLLEMFVSFTD